LALKNIDPSKAPGPDGMITGFFRSYWDLIKVDYLHMILEGVLTNSIQLSITRGVISLLHKGGDRAKLKNWRPITLLNVSYKLYTKALQIRYNQF